MSDRSVIWVRDALVITFSIYVVVAVAMAPWGNLKLSEPVQQRRGLRHSGPQADEGRDGPLLQAAP